MQTNTRNQDLYADLNALWESSHLLLRVACRERCEFALANPEDFMGIAYRAARVARLTVETDRLARALDSARYF